MGKVSVIIPVFNTTEFLKKSIGSLIEQTYKNIEIILIDDASSVACSNSLEELSKQDKRIKLHHFAANMGVAAARNFGIEKATGEFLYFMDSDDYLPKQTIEILINHIKEFNIIRGQTRKVYFSSALAVILDGLYQVKIYGDKKYTLIKNESVLNSLFRADFVRDNQLTFDEDVRLYSDLTFMVPAFMVAGQIPYVKEAVYFKRKRNDAINNPSLSQQDTEVKIKSYMRVYNSLKKTSH
ncbi:glycosyltransferase family 2 protein [Virgibacillus halophilus]|uniref:Glycosyltransferase family 2 protein n=1 Tax=Tigheibacillus halophilus TaxID=361280 RepID=A0ABU5C6E8_9BACI|nr:glycosyltransferase family 2 protein [Virgibacillus halophilus]